MERQTKNISKPRWVKWRIIAACLLILGILFIFPEVHDGRIVINQYKTDTSGCYITPGPGEVVYTSSVRAARERYDGKRVVFLLGFDMFKTQDGELASLSEEEGSEEYQRLISMGYELYAAECWTYQGKGEKKYYTVVVGYFTENELLAFPVNPEYGYFFDFVTDGNGNGISVDEADGITSFSTND